MLSAFALVLCAGAFAQGPAPEKGPAPKNETHFKWYGFIRNYFTYDSRESSAGTEDFFYNMPKDESPNAAGEDLNAVSSFRFAALTSRLGVDVAGYEYDGYKIGAKIEADFYSGVSGVTGTAQMRLRQAYVSLAKEGRSWKIGQAWHPMAADLPDIFSLESGSPFGPFSRTPQVNFENKLSKTVSLTAAAIWQMQYCSVGPSGASANYMKYGCLPELYLGLNFKGEGSLFRVGADVVSIKPSGSAQTKDRLTTVNVFEYGQVKSGDWTFKEKVTYANDGSHMKMVGGYGVSGTDADGNPEYSASRNISGWATAQYKPKGSRWVPSILVGYVKNLGTPEAIVGDFWCNNSASTVAQMYRIQPEVLYNLGKVAFGLEYMLSSVQYGIAGNHGMAETNLHWVSNNRVQMMVKYTF